MIVATPTPEEGPKPVRTPKNPLLVHRLTPRKAWRLVIDEAGFSEDNSGNNVVGIIMPVGEELPSRPDQHLSKMRSDDPKVVEAFSQLVSYPVGVFGVTPDTAPGLWDLTDGKQRDEAWAQCVLEVIQCILHLLPIQGPTHVHIGVEQRGKYSVSDLGFSLQSILHGLRRHESARKRRRGRTKFNDLKLTGGFIDKSDPHVAYADLVAHSWQSTRKTHRRRKQELVNRFRTNKGPHPNLGEFMASCLHTGTARILLQAWEAWQSAETVPRHLWEDLLADETVDEPNSMARYLLQEMGNSVADNERVWNDVLAHTLKHLQSGRVDFVGLRRESEWLHEYKPDSEDLGQGIEYVWLIAQLEQQNHRGSIDEVIPRKIAKLRDTAEDLVPIDVRCHESLVSFVHHTNRFDFAAAAAPLEPWRNRLDRHVTAKFRGRLESTIGQHHAFAAEHDLAEHAFSQALEEFRSLADPETDRRQTATYRAINAMDMPGIEQAALDELMTHAGVSLDSEYAAALARSDAPRKTRHEQEYRDFRQELQENKYLHHLLLRYMVFRRPDELSAAYLAALAPETDPGWELVGHPWQLIAGYRAVLLAEAGDEAGALARFAQARELAVDEGPTVRLIGCAFGLLPKAWDLDVTTTEADIDALAADLPAASERIEVLRCGLKEVGDPREFLAAVLPFNFR